MALKLCYAHQEANLELDSGEKLNHADMFQIDHTDDMFQPEGRIVIRHDHQ